MSRDLPKINGVLIVPHVQVRNANAVSAPNTYGFPAVPAFCGLLSALERKLDGVYPLGFCGIGMICHDFDAQVTEKYPRGFRLARHPVEKDGSAPAIIEAGRIHLDVTLVFGIYGGISQADAKERERVAVEIADLLSTMRVAGGSVSTPVSTGTASERPSLIALPDSDEQRHQLFRRLRRRWLPGFALVSRDDLLKQRCDRLQAEGNSSANLLDAWIDLSRLSHRAASNGKVHPKTGEPLADWISERPPGWIVPIPVGYAALSPLYAPGEVTNARDTTTPFCFVESVYSIGQWVSPHRLESVQSLLWYSDHDAVDGLYLCRNNYKYSASAGPVF